MKKSNALMLSYIIFLAITVFARFRWNWDGLDRIALAASGAGLFFAFADLAGWYISCSLPYAEAFLKDAIVTEEYVSTIIKDKRETKDNLNSVIALLKPHADKKEKIPGIIRDCEKIYNSAAEAEKEFTKIKTDTEQLKVHAEKEVQNIKRVQYLELGLACLGFIAFFTLTCFDKLVELITPYEAVITVSAFVFIMLCYYLRDTVEEKVKLECQEMNETAEVRKQKIENINDAAASKKLFETTKTVMGKLSKDNQQSEAENNG